jgi:hypothetical protein
MRTKTIPVIISVIATLAVTTHATAQDSSDEWELQLAPLYLWAVNLDGTMTVRGVEAPLEVSFDDAFDNLDAAFTLQFEAWQNKWGFIGNFSYLNLSDDVTGPLGLASANVDLKDWIVEASAGYRFHPSAFLILGVRYYKVDGTITPDGPVGLLPTIDVEEGWLDPIVGIGWRPQLSKRVTLNFRGDVGGFGLASDLVWHGFASIDLRVSRHVALGAGYRVMDYDYEKEREQFAFKVEHSGPLAYLRFFW